MASWSRRATPGRSPRPPAVSWTTRSARGGCARPPGLVRRRSIGRWSSASSRRCTPRPRASGRRYDRPMLPLWIVVGVLAVVAVWAVVTYNRFVRIRTRVDNGWSQIDVQLRRRYDLIPNLVETVKGYAAHEREVFEHVTRARAEAVAAQGVGPQARAEDQVTAGLRQLMAVAEAYPDLEANEGFLALQEELVGTESKIAY